MTRILPILISFAYLTSFVFILAMAQSSASHAEEGLSTAEAKQVESLIRETLLNDPQIIVDALEKHQRDQEMAAMEEAAEKAKEYNAKLEDEEVLAVAGNPDGDVTIVEFFDYNCGYCKKALDEMQKVLKTDDNVRVVFRDMPILGPSSLQASKWSMAAERQGKYWEYHQALMNHSGAKNDAVFKKLAEDVGLDVDQLEKDKDDPEIAAKIQQNIQSAQQLGISGTPGFMIGDQLVRGYIPAAQMKNVISQVRGKKDDG